MLCVCVAGYSGWRRCRLSSQPRLRRLASTCVYVLDVSVCVCVCVCGWTQWLEKMQVVYSSKAQEAGVYVLEACGFDSIPAEMALLHATKQFDGRCHCLTHTWLLFIYSILFTLLPQKHRKKTSLLLEIIFKILSVVISVACISFCMLAGFLIRLCSLDFGIYFVYCRIF